MSNKIQWTCPHCGKDSENTQEFIVGGAFNNQIMARKVGETGWNTVKERAFIRCDGCSKEYIVKLETRVVAVVAPVGEFIE